MHSTLLYDDAIAAAPAYMRSALSEALPYPSTRVMRRTLKEMLEPSVTLEEAIGARLYTGPLFVKCAPHHTPEPAHSPLVSASAR